MSLCLSTYLCVRLSAFVWFDRFKTSFMLFVASDRQHLVWDAWVWSDNVVAVVAVAAVVAVIAVVAVVPVVVVVVVA